MNKIESGEYPLSSPSENKNQQCDREQGCKTDGERNAFMSRWFKNKWFWLRHLKRQNYAIDHSNTTIPCVFIWWLYWIVDIWTSWYIYMSSEQRVCACTTCVKLSHMSLSLQILFLPLLSLKFDLGSCRDFQLKWTFGNPAEMFLLSILAFLCYSCFTTLVKEPALSGVSVSKAFCNNELIQLIRRKQINWISCSNRFLTLTPFVMSWGINEWENLMRWNWKIHIMCGLTVYSSILHYISHFSWLNRLQAFMFTPVGLLTPLPSATLHHRKVQNRCHQSHRNHPWIKK